jgi:hypothetical protein
VRGFEKPFLIRSLSAFRSSPVQERRDDAKRKVYALLDRMARGEIIDVTPRKPNGEANGGRVR